MAFFKYNIRVTITIIYRLGDLRIMLFYYLRCPLPWRKSLFFILFSKLFNYLLFLFIHKYLKLVKKVHCSRIYLGTVAKFWLILKRQFFKQCLTCTVLSFKKDGLKQVKKQVKKQQLLFKWYFRKMQIYLEKKSCLKTVPYY